MEECETLMPIFKRRPEPELPKLSDIVEQQLQQQENELFNMPQLPGIRSRRDHTFYDTYLSPEIDQPMVETIDLFSRNGHIGRFSGALTNMQTPGIMSSDQSCTINQMRASLYFDAAINDPSLYAAIQMGCTFIPLVGMKPTRPINMLHQFVEPDPKDKNKIRQRAWPAFEIFYQCGPIGISARQDFGLRIITTPSVCKLVNELQGKKYFKVHVDCVIMRDVC